MSLYKVTQGHQQYESVIVTCSETTTKTSQVQFVRFSQKVNKVIHNYVLNGLFFLLPKNEPFYICRGSMDRLFTALLFKVFLLL